METRDQTIGDRPDDQKELHILYRTLRWLKDGLVFAANLGHAGEVVDELGLGKSKPVSSPVTVDGAARCQDDELKSLDEEEKHCKAQLSGARSAGPEVLNFLSGKCSPVA